MFEVAGKFAARLATGRLRFGGIVAIATALHEAREILALREREKPTWALPLKPCGEKLNEGDSACAHTHPVRIRTY